MVLLNPSITALRELINIYEPHAAVYGLLYNAKKSEIIVFKGDHRSLSYVPPITLIEFDLNGLNELIKFKYLGHIVTESLSDDEDIEFALSIWTNDSISTQPISMILCYWKEYTSRIGWRKFG